ncbi:MAG: RNA-binding protein [Bacteroidota bacterium]|nr:RNA-binding protein [Bacteroidota bacterium]MDP4191466.1 RNA-binding protein [Bacteroidota bacterium]MDP4195899.1 RNA-binding protein [Bacteroidota bacterium]
MNIFVGNLAKEVADQDLMQAFSEFGQVKSVKIIRDLFSGESKGFGFVEMPGNAEALKAMMALNTKDIKGKKISISEARPKGNDRRGGSGNDRRGGNNRNFNSGGKRW